MMANNTTVENKWKQILRAHDPFYWVINFDLPSPLPPTARNCELPKEYSKDAHISGIILMRKSRRKATRDSGPKGYNGRVHEF